MNVNWKKVLLINFLPVILLHLIFFLFWMSLTDPLQQSYISLMEMIFNLIVIPVGLVILNYMFFKDVQNQLVQKLAVMIAVLLIGNLMAYVNWGIASGNLFTPDLMTVQLGVVITLIGVIFVLLVTTVIEIIGYLKAK